ncbi:uncharacterized protein LOC119666019 [Teleopsis dalmanni]|uniref:uncharacterized protein LOC119666019 n=1 Tax=Teleopsis dalmanni TaxID=139649 RepID=UPI0018CD0F60|nr:uncharacterized protein LOC119666019 [Teleopsis dalmanni]
MINNCSSCQKHRATNIKEPMLSHQIPDLSYNKLGLDICEYAKKTYLVVSDYYSRYLDIIALKTKTASKCIANLKVCFSNHGIPLEIVADNMPFNSLQFRNFCKSVDIKLTTTSPRYAQCNGFAEKSVGIAKSLIKKSSENEQELWLALLD